MEDWKVGFAFCGSFCTYDKAMAALEEVHRRWPDVTPIISERSAATDTRFGSAHDFMREMQRICDRRPIDSIPGRRAHRPQEAAGRAGHLPLYGQHPGQAGRRRHRLLGDHGGQGPPAQRPAPGHRSGHQRRPGRQRQEHRRAAGQEERVLCPLPPGRPARASPPPWWRTSSRIPETVEAAMAGRQVQPVLLGSP